MAVTARMLLTVCPLVFLAAAVDAIGGGGGLISLPAYYLAGLPPVLAAGTNKFSACFGTLIAFIRYLRGGKVRLKAALLAAAGALPGAWFGAEILKRTPEGVVRGCLLVGVPLIAALMLLRRGSASEADGPIEGAGKLLLCVLIGLAVGFYDGFFGPGTGTILIILFTLLLRMSAVTASGSAKVVNLASNLAALASLIRGGDVLFAMAVPAMCCSVLGGFAGAGLAMKGGAKVIRPVMLGVMALLLCKIAWDWLLA